VRHDDDTRPGLLVLADGTAFEGEITGPVPDDGHVSGEVVFHTAMSGYQEVLTDPSYAGQIVTFCYPHIGNYGVNPVDDQSRRSWCRGLVVRDLTRVPSSWRAAQDFGRWLTAQGVTVLDGVDTRRLTQHLRGEGSLPGAFGPGTGERARKRLHEAAKAEPGVAGADLVSEVTTPRRYRVGSGPVRLVAYDLGIKRELLRALAEFATVDVVPAGTTAGEVLAAAPDAVFLSNGPGDPSAIGYVTHAVTELLGRVPILGVCMGHQVLAGALGGRTYQLPFGHHGANHPVRHVPTGTVQITSQNHNFAVAADSLPDGAVTHVNLNDGVVEGLAVPDARAMSVQFHPEAAPGPHDARAVFARFERMLEGAVHAKA
jgi:carbamoyl-phosphate synthase small subunit